ncbi:MAG TPA: hypothetical protein VKH82_08605 [Candidatus Binatia bacterium]|nr:hypothetical protein [Candidatus Binatia bacterium]
MSDTPLGTACTENNGAACDGSGDCTAVVAVVRIGDGTTTLTSGVAAPVFIERRLLSGPLVGTPIALPVAASGPTNR